MIEGPVDSELYQTSSLAHLGDLDLKKKVVDQCVFGLMNSNGGRVRRRTRVDTTMQHKNTCRTCSCTVAHVNTNMKDPLTNLRQRISEAFPVAMCKALAKDIAHRLSSLGKHQQPKTVSFSSNTLTSATLWACPRCRFGSPEMEHSRIPGDCKLGGPLSAPRPGARVTGVEQGNSTSSASASSSKAPPIITPTPSSSSSSSSASSS